MSKTATTASAGSSKTLWSATTNSEGEYVRNPSTFRHFVTADGSSGFKAAANRYHLYVSLACPWAHRVLIVRELKGLQDVLPYTVVDWLMGGKGWKFTDTKASCTLDTVNNCEYLRDIYFKVNPEYDGRYTVPVLWDKQTKTIVNNESSELIRMLNTEFNDFCSTVKQGNLDLYPEEKRAEIEDLNSWIYPDINNGVYQSGFATTQEAYDAAVNTLFRGLDRVEGILSKKRYLTGGTLTESDITTLVRFDKVYVGHFKCNKKRIVDYPNMWGYLREIYQIPGIAQTVNLEHIEKHYQCSHTSINPHSIVAIGPDIDFDTPHNRQNLSN